MSVSRVWSSRGHCITTTRLGQVLVPDHHRSYLKSQDAEIETLKTFKKRPNGRGCKIPALRYWRLGENLFEPSKNYNLKFKLVWLRNYKKFLFRITTFTRAPCWTKPPVLGSQFPFSLHNCSNANNSRKAQDCSRHYRMLYWNWHKTIVFSQIYDTKYVWMLLWMLLYNTKSFEDFS